MVPSARSCGWVSSPSLAALNSVKHRVNPIIRSLGRREVGRLSGRNTISHVPPIRRNNVTVRLACGPLRPGGCGRFLGVVAQPWTTARTALIQLGAQVFVGMGYCMFCKYRAVAIVSSGRPRPAVLASHCDGRVARCVRWSRSSRCKSDGFLGLCGLV